MTAEAGQSAKTGGCRRGCSISAQLYRKTSVPSYQVWVAATQLPGTPAMRACMSSYAGTAWLYINQQPPIAPAEFCCVQAGN
jgi:hypothetical protein